MDTQVRWTMCIDMYGVFPNVRGVKLPMSEVEWLGRSMQVHRDSLIPCRA